MNRLKQLRNAKQLKQRDVATILGITSQAYGNYEAERRQLDPEKLRILADFFDVTVDYILGRTNNYTYEPNMVTLVGRGSGTKKFVLTDEQMDMIRAIIDTFDKNKTNKEKY